MEIGSMGTNGTNRTCSSRSCRLVTALITVLMKQKKLLIVGFLVHYEAYFKEFIILLGWCAK